MRDVLRTSSRWIGSMVMAALVTGCGGASEPAGGVAGGATATPEQSAAPSAVDPDRNACHLLGNDEVGALAGRQVLMRDQTEATDRYSTCDYSDANGTFVFGMTVYWSGGREEWQTWQAASGLAADLLAREGTDLDAVVTQGPVSGLGDAAYFSELMPSLVLKDDILIEMKLALVPEAGTKFRALGETLLSRLP